MGIKKHILYYFFFGAWKERVFEGHGSITAVGVRIKRVISICQIEGKVFISKV
jgi:hypothetical protein